MKLLYVQEHLKCENYERSTNPLFQDLFIKEGKTIQKNVEEAEILFIMNGTMHMLCNDVEFSYQKDSTILVPPATYLEITAAEDLTIITLRIKTTIHLCDIQPLENLFQGDISESFEHTYLPMNESIKGFLRLLSQSLADGLRCKCFTELKSKELFYYFRAYHQKEALKKFFAPLFTKDYDFSIFVMQNYRKVKTVHEFAGLYGYSLSCFEKQFKKIFKMSAYQWMTKKKADAIYNALIHTDTSLIELADEYDFSSLSQFCDFCKRIFGTSPGKIRSTRKCLNNFTKMVNQ